MAFFISVLPIIHIVLSVILVGAILLQRSEAGLGAGFGGDGFSAGFHERRGFEKVLFYGTIVIGALFAILALISLIFN
jgi:preprotein translocase subunit SecG